MRISKFGNGQEALKPYDRLGLNEFDYIAIRIPDLIKDQLKQEPLCTNLLSNTTDLVNDALQHIENNDSSFNKIKFDRLISTQNKKKDSSKNRRPNKKKSSPNKKRKTL